MKSALRAALWSEFIGTFALVFCGTGAVVIDSVTSGAVSHVGVSLTFGLVVMALIYTFGETSGAHFNPAVTLAFWAAGRFETAKIAPYIGAQLGGAALASLLLKLMFPGAQTLGATTPRGSQGQSLLLEMVLTWFLMLVILQVSSGAKEKGITAGIAIGGVIGLEALFAGPISGASMNPARSFGPALLSFQLHDLWIYFLGPIIGALLAVPTAILTRNPPVSLPTL